MVIGRQQKYPLNADKRTRKKTPLKVILGCVLLLAHRTSCQFEFPSLFGEYPDTLRAARDPRQDRGPVQFPSAPIGPETSGVRVGASGFGFVPPGGRGRVIGAVGGGPNAFQEFTFW